ncbi:uncharacterized protein ACNLHF_014957 [Anomaloglossus baeobatrachus]|uniref:uncharacterized protein LOC142304357 n=1 Tax=Anomaloglossus baeobatrachus TaxID=238106 RepID=UPI003F5005A3
MRAPGYVTCCLLILELIPQPGISQGAHLLKYCSECKTIIKEAAVTERVFQNVVRNGNYTICPHNIVRFKLPKGYFCGNRLESWVDKVIASINHDRLTRLNMSENQQGSSEGSKGKPPSTTQETTTSTTITTLRKSIQIWEGGTQKSSESTNENPVTTQKTLKTTIGPTTATQGPNPNNGLLHGDKSSAKNEEEEKTKGGQEEGKTKHMTIAIISLILIVLVMTTVATYFVCRKVTINKWKTIYNRDGNVSYQEALVEEPEEQEPGGQVTQISSVLEENCLQDNIVDEVQK